MVTLASNSNSICEPIIVHTGSFLLRHTLKLYAKSRFQVPSPHKKSW